MIGSICLNCIKGFRKSEITADHLGKAVGQNRSKASDD